MPSYAVIQNQKNGFGELCEELYDKDSKNIADWTTTRDEKMRYLGQRYTARLPGLFGRKYKDGGYVVPYAIN